MKNFREPVVIEEEEEQVFPEEEIELLPVVVEEEEQVLPVEEEEVELLPIVIEEEEQVFPEEEPEEPEEPKERREGEPEETPAEPEAPTPYEPNLPQPGIPIPKAIPLPFSYLWKIKGTSVVIDKETKLVVGYHDDQYRVIDKKSKEVEEVCDKYGLVYFHISYLNRILKKWTTPSLFLPLRTNDWSIVVR